MPATHRPRSVRVPSDMVLSARTMAQIAARFPAAELGDLIERLIDQLDAVTVEADLEPERRCAGPDPQRSRSRPWRRMRRATVAAGLCGSTGRRDNP